MAASELLESKEENEMRGAFTEQINEILENEDRYENNNEDWKIGLEVEYASVDENFNTPPRELRNNVINSFDFADFEVGATQIEMRTSPENLTSFSSLEEQLNNREKKIAARAQEESLRILRLGTNPFVDINRVERTDKPKYEEVPNFHDEHRHPSVQQTFGRKEGEVIDPRSADIAALINSAQANVEAEGFEDATVKANFTYMISPYISALSANSQFMDHKDLGFADTRMLLWEKSHDIRSEEEIPEEPVSAGKLNEYYKDIEDYFERVREEPFILHDPDHALDIGIGTYWKDSRIKFIDDEEADKHDILVESRAMSTQPTVEEEIAMHAFYIGRLAYAQNEEFHEGGREEKLDIKKVNRNRYSAMHKGLDTKLYTPDGELMEADEVLRREISKAKEGLEAAGIEADQKYFDVLDDRLEEGSPSSQMAEGFRQTERQEFEDEEEYRKQALKNGLSNQNGGLEV